MITRNICLDCSDTEESLSSVYEEESRGISIPRSIASTSRGGTSGTPGGTDGTLCRATPGGRSGSPCSRQVVGSAGSPEGHYALHSRMVPFHRGTPLANPFKRTQVDYGKTAWYRRRWAHVFPLGNHLFFLFFCISFCISPGISLPFEHLNKSSLG